MTTLEGKRDRTLAYIKSEGGIILKNVQLIRERWVPWFHTVLNAKSPRLDPKIAKGLHHCPENMPLGVQPTTQEPSGTTHSIANRTAVGSDRPSVGLLNIALNDDPALGRGMLDILV